VKKHNVEFLAIQETILEVISNALCHNIWGGVDCDWAFLLPLAIVEAFSLFGGNQILLLSSR